MHVDAFFLAVNCCLDDGAGLHFCDFWISVAKTASTVTEHRVELFKRVALALHLFDGDTHLVCQFFLSGKLMRHELMQWWVEQTDCHAETVHSLEDSLEVGTLDRQQFVKSCTASFLCVGKNHLAHCLDTVALEEHMLCAAKTDTFGSEFAGYESIAWRVGICADINLGVFLSKVHDCCEVA